MIEDLPADPAEVTSAERDALRRALEIAATGQFNRTGGNPRVGCVLLDARQAVVAQAHHRGAGTLHAEAAALSVAGEAAQGGTAIVTLEPCTHQGRTGPCTDALIAAGIARVVFGYRDPNPVATGGAERLRAAGIAVIGPVLTETETMINSDWVYAQRVGRPRVRLKIASTLDGRVAAADGTSQWITSEAARADAHQLRADSDAVLAGTGTVLADDPRLTVRLDNADETADQPLRAIFGTTEIPADAAVFRQSGETVCLRTRSAAVALAELRSRGVSSVLIEGGPGVAAAFLNAGLVEEVISYVAPALLGTGPSATGDLGRHTIADILRGQITDVRTIGTGPDQCVRIVTRLTPSTHPENDLDRNDHEGAN